MCVTFMLAYIALQTSDATEALQQASLSVALTLLHHDLHSRQLRHLPLRRSKGYELRIVFIK